MFPSPQIGNFTVTWFNLVIFTDTIICIIFFYLQCVRIFKNSSVVSHQWLLFFGVVLYISVLVFGGFFGAKQLAKTETFLINYNEHTFQGFINVLMNRSRGYSWYGGLLFNLLLMPLLLLLFNKKNVLRIVDITSLTCCLAYAIGRWGCLLTGDKCYGTWTNLPWGAYFPYSQNPNILPVHPTPLYESLIHFFLLILLLYTDKKKMFLGQTTCIFLFVSALSRFLIEFIRINEKIAFDLTMAQLISVFLIFFSLLLYYITRNYKTLTIKNLPS